MKILALLFVSLPCFAQDSVKVLPVSVYVMLVDRAWYGNLYRDSVIQSQDLHITALQMVLDSTRINHRQETNTIKSALNSSEQLSSHYNTLAMHWKGEARKRRKGNRLLKIAVPVGLVLGFWAGSR